MNLFDEFLRETEKEQLKEHRLKEQMMEIEDKIIDRAEAIQSDLHNSINKIHEKFAKNKLEYQDYVTVFLINKIAALEIALETK